MQNPHMEIIGVALIAGLAACELGPSLEPGGGAESLAAIELEAGDGAAAAVPGVCTSVFSDVSGQQAPYVSSLHCAGITRGCADGDRFCPDAATTRAQAAVFLLRSLHGGDYAPPAATGHFSDTAGHWAEDWAEQLFNEGVTRGCGGDAYCPDAAVTRAQVSVLLLRAVHGSSFQPPAATGHFADTAGSWAEPWIEQLYREGITKGCGGGNYCPDAVVTRGMMAIFLDRSFCLRAAPHPTAGPGCECSSDPVSGCAVAGGRGRVQVVAGKVKADNGVPLRGDTMHVVPGYGMNEISRDSRWLQFRDTYHLNTVRMLVFRNGTSYQWDPQYFGSAYMTVDELLPLIDVAVDRCAEFGMYCVVDYHTEPRPIVDDITEFWDRVAPRYRDRAHVLYELANEPVGWSAGSYTAADIQLQKDIYHLIRAHAPDTHVITHSFAQGRGPMRQRADQAASGPGAISYARASVGFHSYHENRDDVLLLTQAYPAFVTELSSVVPGAGIDDDDLLPMTLWYEQQGISWIWLHFNNANPPLISPAEVSWPADPGCTQQ